MKIIADTNIPYAKECFASLGEVTLAPGRQMTPELVRDADALLVRSVTPANAALLEGSRVKFVATATIGFDHVDRSWLDSKGIGFASAPGSNANSVGEYIVAAMHVIAIKKGFQLEGKSLGIVGVGNVGSIVEKKARALGMKVVLNDPPLARQTGDPKYRPLPELFACDFITFHVPLNKSGQDKTHHMADSSLISMLKPGIVFMNSSRGSVMETAAVKAAIKGGHFSACVLDVWENEPNIDAELLSLVDIATPHIAGYSYDGKVAGTIMIYEAFCRHFGFKAGHTMADFLPAPLVPTLDIDARSIHDQTVVHNAVKSLYDIMADDRNTRQILALPAAEQGKYFDKLRKDYPIRREFQNTRITLRNASGALAAKLGGIGFKVR
jgi:erythronate-4-phosphate dehydrogenase